MSDDQDQSSQGDMPSVLRDFLAAWMRDEVDDMLPARVVSYDDATNRAVLKPLVQMGTADGRKISRPNQVNVPVFRFGGGGFFIRMPLKAGDFGWLKANDRDISLVLQRGGQEDWPNTIRTHDFSDAMFFPDSLRGWAIDGANIDSMVIQSLDGSVCIALGAGSLKLTAPSIELTSGTLTHNGVSIGDTHTHTGSPSAPDGPVSNTGTPI